ncbi:triphosphoribosyl-dephospho-CoA synthase [Haloarchaeobius iranensis]|uniref:Triphosphoribosyl-dephospho-CoA synthase n=1 Tax=Haloarchaeobius iranensis TaxID=996166 RepID=A0A1G9W6H9_9EURY|nr:triphosphoribosyl-dephospho-CoA synthase [Haloarchaeobius iranensis]SDM79923.1 triphosphoribosyl-dephospho-CoA synthase [Haloarchaeobius iranensis]
MRTAQHAQLALLLEVAGTPKPGNVDRRRDFDDLRFEHFLTGAVGACDGLEAAAAGEPVGESFDTAVAGMSQQRGGNAQFGALLLLVPLVRAATTWGLTPEEASATVEATTVDDAAGFYRAFEHVDVFVEEPPPEAEDLDVRRGADAIPALRDRELTLYDVMELSAPEDGVAAEWTNDFRRTFAAAETVRDGDGPVPDRVAEAFIELLAREPDTMVAKQHGPAVAESVRERAAMLRHAARDEREAFADELVERGVNPGTMADITAAATFVALERDGVVP